MQIKAYIKKNMYAIIFSEILTEIAKIHIRGGIKETVFIIYSKEQK